jgi:cold shock CspA family protein
MPTPPAGPLGTVSSGRITRLVSGQRHGFIRLTDHREVFFHRSDLREGTAFGELVVGDSVIFELVDDPVSGPRARGVHRRQRMRSGAKDTR